MARGFPDSSVGNEGDLVGFLDQEDPLVKL